MELLLNLSYTLIFLLLTSGLYLLFKKVINFSSLKLSLINFKNCFVYPKDLDSYVAIFFSIVFLIIPVFLGLSNFLRTDGNVVVVIFAIAWIYNWIKYTYLVDKLKLDSILQKNNPFYEKYLSSIPLELDQHSLTKHGLNKIQKEYNIPLETISKIYSENPYWQKLCGREFFESTPLSFEQFSELNNPTSNDDVNKEPGPGSIHKEENPRNLLAKEQKKNTRSKNKKI